MSASGRSLNKEGLRTPDRMHVKPALFTFNKPPLGNPWDNRTAPEFSLQSPTPIRRLKGHSLDLFSPCDSSTIASSRLNSSLLCSSQAHSRSMSGFKDLTPIRGKDAPEIQVIRQKLQQQEVRLMTFLKRVRAKEKEAEEARDLCYRLKKDLRESNEKITNLQQIISNYECQIATLTEKTTSSLEKLLSEKSSELEKMQREMRLFRDQYEAKVEAEVMQAVRGKELERGKVDRLGRELEAATTRIKHLTAKNAELYDEIAGYQRSLSQLKHRTETGNVYVTPTQVSTEDFIEVQTRMKDLEDMQLTVVQENHTLKTELALRHDQEKTERTTIATLCGDLFRHRCTISLFSRVLACIRDGETFNLNQLLRSRYDAQQTQGYTLQSCVAEVRLIEKSFDELERAAVEWYSAQCGDSCKVS